MSIRPPAKLRREASPEREKSQAQQVIAKVLDDIKAAIKRPEKMQKAYVCYADLQRIWSDKSKIAALIQSSSPSDEQIDYIQTHMIIILSTLVYIGAVDCLAAFRSRFFRHINSHRALYEDSDIPYFEKSKLKFLDPEPASQEQFYENQFMFKPVILEIKKNQTTQTVDPKQRLPFESLVKDVGAGGYGKVDRVGISPRYIKQPNGWDSRDVYTVACKKVTIAKDFDKEKENLQILKESLTSHVRIMLHLTTIEHGPNRYILLPYAAYGDLELFLHCGIAPGPEQEKKYDFDRVFNRIGDSNITFPLLSECWSLANALEWLHNQIKIEKSSDTVFCAHMDLKPANILIDPDDESVVGKWKISDFGISVFKEDTQRQDSEYGSIGDYISQVTMNTRPKRQEGTYQAPEVKLAENVFSQSSHLTPDQRGIGRKSDIWSFGCILAEILAFSHGRSRTVREFQTARKKNARDDYFYAEKLGPVPQYLTAMNRSQGPTKEYEVRPTVTSWLEGLCDRVSSPSKWVDCYVGTIEEILIVDTQKRPDATELLKLLRHVKDHVLHSRNKEQTTCPILKRKLEEAVPTRLTQRAHTSPSIPSPMRAFKIPRKAIVNANPVNDPVTVLHPHHSPDLSENSGAQGTKGFKFIRQTTFEKEVIHTVKGHHSSPEKMELVEEDDSQSSILDSQSSERRTNTALLDTVPSSTCLPQDDESNTRPSPTPIQPQDPELDQQITKSSGHRSSLFTSFAKPAYAYGIMIDRLVVAGGASNSIHLPYPDKASRKIARMAITRYEDGGFLACLTKNAVYIYMLGAESILTKFYKNILLPGPGGWDDISISGHYMTVWGYFNGKLLYFCDIENALHPRHFSAQEILVLDKVAVSQQGVAALVCREKIIVCTLNAQKTTTLYASSDQNFTHAAFNDTGNLLFAWAYGQTDTLYCWRCQDGVMNPATESESSYETVGKSYRINVTPAHKFKVKTADPNLTRVIPYNSYQGCIVERSDKRLFPAQIHSTLRELREPLARTNEIPISNLRTATIFNDHSFVTVEKGTWHYYLWEYKINYHSTHHLTQPPVLVSQLKSSPSHSSQLLAINRGGKDGDVVVIICNKNGTVEFVKVICCQEAVGS